MYYTFAAVFIHMCVCLCIIHWRGYSRDETRKARSLSSYLYALDYYTTPSAKFSSTIAWIIFFLLSCVGFHILLSQISNFKPIIYFQKHKNVSLLIFSFFLSVSRGRHVLNILISMNLSINLKQNQIRINKNYTAPRQHTSRTNLIRHCKITALYGITKGEILYIYAPNQIRADFLIEIKRKSLLSFTGKSPRS